MGHLGIPTKDKKRMQDGNVNIRRFKRSNYSNPDAVKNLIRYVTRTRENEDRAQDLLVYGAVGAGYYLHPDNIIQQFLHVQNAYGINRRGGRRMYHEVFNLYDSEAMELRYDPEQFRQIGMKCCQIYYQMGFQTVFAVHWEQDKHYHIHFAVNGISFDDGCKWHTSLPSKKLDQGEETLSLEKMDQREKIFNQILYEHQMMINKPTCPLYFVDSSFSVQIVFG